jgi:hypothetical protein
MDLDDKTLCIGGVIVVTFLCLVALAVKVETSIVREIFTHAITFFGSVAIGRRIGG